MQAHKNECQGLEYHKRAIRDDDEIFIIRPHSFFFMSGITSFDNLKHDIIVELKAFCQSVSSRFSKVLGGGPPVLLTNISIEPK